MVVAYELQSHVIPTTRQNLKLTEYDLFIELT